MRKTIRRLAVLLLAVILCLSLPITAMAENGGGGRHRENLQAKLRSSKWTIRIWMI